MNNSFDEYIQNITTDKPSIEITPSACLTCLFYREHSNICLYDDKYISDFIIDCPHRIGETSGADILIKYVDSRFKKEFSRFKAE